MTVKQTMFSNVKASGGLNFGDLIQTSSGNASNVKQEMFSDVTIDGDLNLGDFTIEQNSDGTVVTQSIKKKDDKD